MTRARERPTRRRPADKFEERRRELADAAIQTLSELGYARTSLREIAQKSAFSHGVLHYYFSDKIDLITYCVRQYKAVCVRRYDDIVTTAAAAEQLAAGFADGLVQTLREDGRMHRLWYDLRSQALFDESFRSDVLEIDSSLEDMIWRIVGCYAQLRGAPLAVTRDVAYAMFDGLFQQSLLRFLAGHEQLAADELRAGTLQLLALVVGADREALPPGDGPPPARPTTLPAWS